LLAEKIQKHQSNVWLVNTGWSGGAHGVGKRMKLSLTRAIIDAIHSGDAAKAPTAPDPFFGVGVVTACPGVPREVLTPQESWADRNSYQTTARKLAGLFRDNFRQYADKVAKEVKEAGPVA
jgi:phosphoenolpyruvate carboxykinase (ATP)